ncbi:hypothetical protein EGH73_02870 [Epilithonimonas hominis]|uniref:Uncharacterized protein n=1 Tax=Epilithonimonas hominis TaxID=420404 RepID=A0A3N0XB10_9FLAO|nr:hypothetical protein EGH73_02870 [Epilithonimonas hominis]HAP94865.1 hypothetical protein [Chryseobacterium sp.]
MKKIIKFVIYGSLAFYIFLFSFIGTITDNNDARKISLALLIIVVGCLVFKNPLKKFVKKIFT